MRGRIYWCSMAYEGQKGVTNGCPFEIVTARSQQNFRRELFHDVPRLLAKFISSSCISSVAFSYHSIDLYRCPGGSFLRSLVCSWTLWECGSFFYVLPRRIRTGGTLGFWQSSNPDQNLIRLERLWDTLSTIGLACVIIGILLQAASVWISWPGQQKPWQNLVTEDHGCSIQKQDQKLCWCVNGIRKIALPNAYETK